MANSLNCRLSTTLQYPPVHAECTLAYRLSKMAISVLFQILVEMRMSQSEYAGSPPPPDTNTLAFLSFSGGGGQL